jgi:hypothetical protein
VVGQAQRTMLDTKRALLVMAAKCQSMRSGTRAGAARHVSWVPGFRRVPTAGDVSRPQHVLSTAALRIGLSVAALNTQLLHGLRRDVAWRQHNLQCSARAMYTAAPALAGSCGSSLNTRFYPQPQLSPCKRTHPPSHAYVQHA